MLWICRVSVWNVAGVIEIPVVSILLKVK